MPDIVAKSWRRYAVIHFSVEPDLMGASHEFLFEQHRVTVRLPRRETVDRDEPKFNPIAFVKSFRAETNEPLEYLVAQVELEIHILGSISVPVEALVKPPCLYELFSIEQRKSVDDICEIHPPIAERAFEYWLEIIRWSSGFAVIGQPEIIERSVSGTYIHDNSTNRRIWNCGQISAGQWGPLVNKQHWDKASTHLANGDILPMQIRFLHDAETSVRNGYYEKSIFELAMACEIYLRSSVFKTIPNAMPNSMVTYIRKASISQYINKFFKKLVPRENKEQYSLLAENILLLMTDRNSYAHEGRMYNVNLERCRRYVGDVKLLFTIPLTNEPKPSFKWDSLKRVP